jgi:hypothetical protein
MPYIYSLIKKMKRIIVILVLVFAKFNLYCQVENKSQKIWFYKVINMGGARIDPEIQPEQKENSYYMAFFEKKPQAKISNIFFWFRDGAVNTGNLQLASTALPIVMEKEVLVPKNKNLVVGCNLQPVEVLLLPSYVKKLLKSNELVATYSINNKKYYSLFKTIKTKVQHLP